VVSVVGKGFHRFCEYYFQGNSIEQATEYALKYVATVPDSEIDFGKTGSREKINTELAQAIKFFLQEVPSIGTVLAAEDNTTAEFYIGDMKAPVPVKAISDLVTDIEGEIWLWDWKVVTSFTDKEEDQPDYVMQAMFNYHTVLFKYKKAPTGVNYVEVKKSANKSGEPQLQVYEIRFSNHPEYFKYFYNIYTAFIRAMANPDFIFLPNFSDPYSGKESWKDFTSELLDFEMPRQVSHKSVLTRNIDDVSFVESAIHSVKSDNLPDSDLIRVKLLEFGISVELQETHTGPSVTLYAFRPSRGVSMSKISKYEDDLALALGAKSVRIEAPIRGTKLVGVEVGNHVQKKVDWSEEHLMPGTLQIPVGVDVYNKVYHLDLAKAPHLLVAGATGSGKSVSLSVIIHSLVKQNSEDQMGLILIDPKQTEFYAFEDVPHLMSGIISEPEDVDNALEWAISEMDKRYRTLRASKARNIDEFMGGMKKIVIVIDELADLMLSDFGSSIENKIVRLAQKARAAGIHLICATQRPSVDVVTGILKANFPTRIAYMTSTRVDSAVILDQAGAEQLLGNGDCLVMSPREKGLVRLQGFFL
jgi:hypothetical protein